jgi:hypothetical protein
MLTCCSVPLEDCRIVSSLSAGSGVYAVAIHIRADSGRREVVERGILSYRASRETGLHKTDWSWDEAGGVAVGVQVHRVKHRLEPCYSIRGD